MKALRNKKTGRLLVLDVGADKEWGYGITEPTEIIRKHLELRDSEFPDTIFCTSDEGVIANLLKDGKCTYPDIRINFGWNRTRFEIGDLESVSLKEES